MEHRSRSKIFTWITEQFNRLNIDLPPGTAALEEDSLVQPLLERSVETSDSIQDTSAPTGGTGEG